MAFVRSVQSLCVLMEKASFVLGVNSRVTYQANSNRAIQVTHLSQKVENELAAALSKFVNVIFVLGLSTARVYFTGLSNKY